MNGKVAKGVSYQEAMRLKDMPDKTYERIKRAQEYEYHMTEGCGIWAVEFANKNGGQIYILSATPGEVWSDDIPYEVTHAFVEKDGKTVDVRGPRSVEEMARELNISNYSIKGPWPADVFEDMFMGDSDDKPLYGMTAAEYKGGKYYHGSQTKFKPGTILTPQSEGYVNTADPDIQQTERIFESQRPKGRLPRKDSVFMVGDPEEVDLAGGYEDYIHEVEPIGRVEKNDMDWYSNVGVYHWKDENDPEAIKLAKGYWSGKALGAGKHTLFEYRAPKAKVVRLISEEPKVAAYVEYGKDWDFKHMSPCPACGRNIYYGDAQIGKELQCPKCFVFADFTPQGMQKIPEQLELSMFATKQEPAMRGGQWNPKANLGYHWTDAESLQLILDSGRWDAGSVTVNPAYRFNKGVPGETRYALVFDLSKGFKPREDKTVPWSEWEWLADNDVDIWDMPGGAFLGFGVRSGKAAKEIRAMLKEDFDEPRMFPVAIVPAVTKAAASFLFHGTSHAALVGILANGGVINAPSFWGTEAIANYYAEQEGEAAYETDDPGFVITRIPLARFNRSKFEVDNASLVDPITTALGRDESELQEMWTKSKNTWQDSLRIYGSVKYNAPVKITEGDVYEEVDSLYKQGSKTAALKDYVGNCTEDNIVEQYWGDATMFAQALEAAEKISENTVFDPKSGLLIKYDPETDIHSFFSR